MILGINGKAGAGKDTLADILIKHFGYRKVSWADALKSMLSEALEIPLNDFYARSKDNIRPVTIDDTAATKLMDLLTESYGEIDNYTDLRLQLQNTSYPSLRVLMQEFGTRFARYQIDPEIWIKITKKNLDMSELLIFSDCRMENERKAVREMGGFNMIIKRDLAGDSDSHETENNFGEDSEYDFIVENNSCLSSLYSSIILWHTLRFKQIDRL